MSTGADCSFKEREPSVWFYRIQNYPYGETEEYSEHGPFYSFKSAERHLEKRYANPGGFMIDRHPDSTEEIDDEGAFT